ncbi:MAG: WD40 repeat domain-containing protein [Myxococcota bacterium]
MSLRPGKRADAATSGPRQRDPCDFALFGSLPGYLRQEVVAYDSGLFWMPSRDFEGSASLGGNFLSSDATKAHSGGVKSVDFSPCGRYLVTTGAVGAVKVWDAERGTLCKAFPYCRTANSATSPVALAGAARNLTIAALLQDHTVGIWSAFGEVASRICLTDGSLECIALSPDRRWVGIGIDGHQRMGGHEVRVFNVDDGSIFTNLFGHCHTVRSLAFSADSKLIATGGDDGALILWNLETRQAVETLEHCVRVKSIAFSPGSRYLLAALQGEEHAAVLWDLTLRRRVAVYPHEQELLSASFCSVHPARVATVTSTGVRFFRLKGNLTAEVEAGPEGIRACAIHPERPTVAVAHKSGWVSLHRPDSANRSVFSQRSHRASRVHRRQGVPVIRGQLGGITAVDVSQDGSTIATAGEDGTVRLWCARTQRMLLTLRHGSSVNSIAFRAEYPQLASATADGEVRLWDTRTGRLVFVLKPHRSPHHGRLMNEQPAASHKRRIHPTPELHSIAIAPSGAYLASGDADGKLSFWNLETRSVEFSASHQDSVQSVAFARDGQLVASVSQDGEVQVWNVQAKQFCSRYEHPYKLRSVAFLGPGNRLVTAGDGCSASILKIRYIQSELLHTCSHEDWVNAAVSSPSGSHLATASDDQTVKLWNPSTGQLIHSYAHNAAVTSLAWFPKGPRSGEHRLVLGDEHGTATILGTSSASPGAGFRGHAPQRLKHLYTLG